MENNDLTTTTPAGAPMLSPSSYKNSTYVLISLVAYLIGIPKSIFDNEHEPPKLAEYEKLENDKNARIIRSLCRLRNATERNFKKIYTIMNTEYKNLSSIPEYVPVECFPQLAEDGVRIAFKNDSRQLGHFIIELNKHISDRINNCRDLFPLWINWAYVRDLFIMPNGLTEEGIKEAANLYFTNMGYYPYQVYINWEPFDAGNLLYNDKRFATYLYYLNKDEFKDLSKVSDVSDLTKSNIYDFIENSNKTVFVVDCENSDPYKLCATLRNLDIQYTQKISKIILYDDVNSASAWSILESYTNLPIERILTERVKTNKSLVDISLTAGTCREFYQNNVDSFVLVSSDSDYWGLITSIPGSKFLVMLEREKTGPDIKVALFSSGIFYCFIDDFYSGNCTDIKTDALIMEIYRYLDASVNVNFNEIVEAAYRTTRISVTEAEQRQFHSKYMRLLQVELSDEGDILIRFKRK